MRTKDDLRILQALPLDIKIRMTVRRLMDWISYYGEDGVYLSWSGGKDSTVLRHIIMQEWPDVVSVFVNTGLEYPEIQQFVKAAQKRGEPVEILRPKMRFDEVIKKHGYPVIGKKQAEDVSLARKNIKAGKYTIRLRNLGIMPDQAEEMGLSLPGKEMLERYERTCKGSKYYAKKYSKLIDADFQVSAYCCEVMKKGPAREYQKRSGKTPILATMASESMMRESAWLSNGCNSFDSKKPRSAPMSFWTEQDVLEYIKTYNVEIPSVYGDVVYAEEPEQMRIEEVGVDIGFDKLCTTGCHRTGCIFCAFGAHIQNGSGADRFLRLKRTHPRQYAYCIGGGEYNEDGIWQPNKDGLGMGHVFDEINRLYGDGFIKY